MKISARLLAPEGFEGPLTIEGLVTGATEQAREVLEENEHLVAAIAAHLVEHQDEKWTDPDLTGLHHELTAVRELVSS